MVIPFSFTFKSPTLHKYASASSLSKSSKFLILQFLVKCCKLHSVFKILSKSHMLDIFLIQVCTNWANMWYPDYQNKKLNLCMLNSFKGFHLCIKWAIMLYPDKQLKKKLNLCMLLQANKNIICKDEIGIQKFFQSKVSYTV